MVRKCCTVFGDTPRFCIENRNYFQLEYTPQAPFYQATGREKELIRNRILKGIFILLY